MRFAGFALTRDPCCGHTRILSAVSHPERQNNEGVTTIKQTDRQKLREREREGKIGSGRGRGIGTGRGRERYICREVYRHSRRQA